MKIKLNFPVVNNEKPTKSVYQRIDNAHSWEELYDKGSPDEHPELEEYYRNKFFNTYKKFLQPDEYFETYRTNVHHDAREGGILRGSTYLRICSKKNPFYESEIRFGDHWNGHLPDNCGSFKIKNPLGKGAGRITTLKTHGDNFKSDPTKIVEVGRRVFHTEHFKDAKEIDNRGWKRTKTIVNSDKTKSVTSDVNGTRKGTVHLPPKKSPVPLVRPTPPPKK